MARFTTIQKKVTIPYSLKSYFGSGSYEFGQLDFEKKLSMFRSVVSNGFSIYDLTEEFRKHREDRYDQEDMKNVLCSHIAELIYSDPISPYVSTYYKDNTYEDVAKELDKFVINPIDSSAFMELLKKKFGITS